MNPTNEQIEEMCLGMFNIDISEFDIEDIASLRDLLQMRLQMNKEKQTEKRLYSLVPYNLSEIQKGIQTQHCVTEYSNKFIQSGAEYIKGKSFLDKEYFKYTDWAKNWKTTIVLNGGTTNNNKDSPYYGTLQRYRDDLQKLGVTYAEFHEPDLNDALTAVCFIVDIEKDWIVLKYLQDMKLA